ncbi:GNAT family N-acetyltransferase [Paenibacillus macerans]|uniref:GNAT family N-acetyltransferase n=1 Tax=Paenibacillus macerans TaxID=44252 RepID=UPI003D32014D
MIDGITIAPLVPADREAVCRVFELAIPDAFAREGLGDLEEEIHGEIGHKQKMLNSALASANAGVRFLIAKAEGEVVGTISFGPCGKEIRECTHQALDDVGELGSLYILPSYQGQGLGSALIKALATQLHRQGIKRFCLDSGYRRAQQRWLRKFGEPYTVGKDYWGPGHDHMVWLCNVKDYAG